MDLTFMPQESSYTEEIDYLELFPWTIDTPDKMRIVVNYLKCKDHIYSEREDETPYDGYDVSVTPFGEPFLLTLTKGNEVLTYNWNEIPSRLRGVLSEISHWFTRVDALDYLERVDDYVQHSLGNVRCRYFPKEKRINLKTNEIPCLPALTSDCDDNKIGYRMNTNDIQIELDSINGISIYQDGELILDGMWPYTIQKWMKKAAKFDELHQEEYHDIEYFDDELY